MYDHPELAVYATDRFVLVCIALFFEAVIGRAMWLFQIVPHPYALLQSAAAFFEAKLNRSRRGPRALVVRGAIVTFFLCGAAGSIGWALSAWSQSFRSGWVIDLAFMVLFVSQRGGYGDASRTIRALTRDGLSAGRKAVAAYHGGNPARLDDHGICRGLTEHLASELGRWLVGPVFWYLLGGLPGLFLYVAVLALAHGFARDDEARTGFGWMAVRLERIAGWLPGRLAGVLVVLASLLAPTARPIQAWRAMVKWAGTLPTPAFGWPAAAYTGALSIELGGPNAAEGRPLPWFGEGSPRIGARDAHRAMILFGYCCVLHGAVAAGMMVARVLTM